MFGDTVDLYEYNNTAQAVVKPVANQTQRKDLFTLLRCNVPRRLRSRGLALNRRDAATGEEHLWVYCGLVSQ